MIEPLPRTVITCPVLDCDWTHDVPEPDPRSRKQATLADVFGPGVYAAAAVTQEAWALERVLDAHFRTHSTADYVRTMANQRTELAAAAERLEQQRERTDHLHEALDAVTVALDLEAPRAIGLTEWVRAMRTVVMRLRHPERIHS